METDAGKPVKSLGLRAFGIIYLALTLAGAAASIAPRWPLGRPLAVLLFMALVALYMFGTASGRRTSGKAYVLAALLCPLILVVLAFGGLALMPFYDAYILISALSNGFRVGFEIGGSEAIPVWISFLLWWLGIAAAVSIPLMIRAALLRSRAGRRSAREVARDHGGDRR